MKSPKDVFERAENQQQNTLNVVSQILLQLHTSCAASDFDPANIHTAETTKQHFYALYFFTENELSLWQRLLL